MEKNKTGMPTYLTGRYLKYAIGEIILVVIGILIALQINRWNEIRNENVALQILTENLKKEFTDNYQELETDIIRLKRKISAGKNLLSYTGIEEIEITEFKVDSLIFETIESPTWNPSSFVLNDIKNSGKLSTLKSKKLKELLYNWERKYEDILEWHTAMQGSGTNLLDIINAKGSLINIDFYKKNAAQKSKFKISNKSLLQEIHFENALENNMYAAIVLEKKYNEAKTLIKKIIEVSKSDHK